MKKKLEIVKKLKSVLGRRKNIVLHEPDLDLVDLRHLRNCFKSGMISTVGDYVKKFENEIKNITKSKYIISVSNGTIGLFISLKVTGVKSDDEVLIPAVSFVATANAVAHCNATPHFVDIGETDLGIDPIRLDEYLKKNTYMKKNNCFNKKTKKPIKAIIPVHVFGHPCNINKIIKVCKKYKIRVIEDAAEGIGSYSQNKHVGTFGDVGVFSFNGNKIVTTGGGGAIITNNVSIYKKIKHLCTTAKINHPWKYLHNEIGYNFRLPALNAALGYSQLLKINKLRQKKFKLYKIYKKLFAKTKEIEILGSPKNCQSNFWLQTIVLSKKAANLKTKIIKDCHSSGLKVRPLWDLISSFKMYKKCPKMNLKNSKLAYSRIINLPSSSTILK